MKKFLSIMLSLVSAIALCLCFSACDKDEGPKTSEYVGEWKLYSLMSNIKGYEGVEYRVGQEVEAGLVGNAEKITLTADYSTLSVKQDGTFVWKNDYTLTALSNYREINGTWTESEMSTVFTTPEGNYVATFEGNRLALKYDADITRFDRAE